MLSAKPKVSVIMAAYNHARFIREAIESVLNQTYGELELLIVDDGSSDETLSIARSIRDPRIQVTGLAKNSGACIAGNTAINSAKGELIAIISSDDVWEKTKLDTQVQFLRDNPSQAAVFSRASFINDESTPIELGQDDVFRQKNRSRTEWLRDLFLDGNCLCHPSLLIYTNVYQKIGLYDNRLRQLPDYDMWLRFLKAGFSFYIQNEPLIRFRVHGDGNTSSLTDASARRIAHELNIIMRSFTDGLTFADFEASFGFEPNSLEQPAAFALAKLKFFLNPMSKPFARLHRQIGIEMYYEMLGNPQFTKHLKSAGMDDLDFQRITGEDDPFNMAVMIKPLCPDLTTTSGRAMVRELRARVKKRANEKISKLLTIS
jgi:glycosyltransferase involved in cell wall biosynthesis